MKEKAQGDVALFEKEADAIRAKMAALKTTLYGKFGNTINLEE